MESLDAAQARGALDAIDQAHRAVQAEVGMPRWYWWLLAAGWMVLGVVGDLAAPWVAALVTVAFGATHAAVAGRRLTGRRRTAGASVSAATAGRRTAVVLVVMLVLLVVLTVGAALALAADGTQHAATAAGVAVAIVVGFGGPEILAAFRRWARA